MHAPEFSTILITRPREPELQRAVRSALSQVGVQQEVIVVLDGPCAQNRAALQELAQDPALRILEHPSQLGRGAARRTAVDAARGEWLATVDADDWIHPEKLLRQKRFLAQHPELSIASMGLIIADRQGQLSRIRSEERFGFGLEDGQIPEFPTPSMVVKASLARQFPYNPACIAGEDRDFLQRVLADRPWGIQDEALYVYHEYNAHSWARCMTSYGRRSRMAWQHQPAMAALGESLKNVAKAALASTAFAVGQGDLLVKRRSRAISSEELKKIGF